MSVLFTAIFIFKWWLDNYLTGVPTHIPYDLKSWVLHFCLLIKLWSTNLEIQNSREYNIVYGFAARSLLQTFLDVQKTPLKILTTPIHHTSFINILNDYNTKIMEFTDDYRELIFTEQDIIDADIVIVTHLFGRNFSLEQLKTICVKYNTLLFIDAITGFKEHSNPSLNDNADITLYSAGQDKRPVALGGGFAIIKDAQICTDMKNLIATYPKQTNWHRLLQLINLFFIRIVYMYPIVHLLIHLYAKVRKQKLSTIVSAIRKFNSGFAENDYMYEPHASLVASLDFELTYCQEETKDNVVQYKECWTEYLSNLNEKVLRENYPFYDKYESISQPYHQIFISDEQKRKEFANICDKFMLPCIKSTNYNVLDDAPIKYHKFNSGILNLSSIIKKKKHIEKISEIVNMLVE